MPVFHLRLAAPPYSTLKHVPLFGYVGEATHFAQNPENWNYYLPVLRNRSPSVILVSSFPRLHCLGAAHSSADMAENCDIMDICHSLLDINAHESPSVNDNDSLSKEEKERQRRKKIGQANKGRIPWNKGRKHSSETCERIKQRTIEALKDPKVRKKMSEHPRPHSAESKAKMRSSLRRVWGQRLKWKRLREKIFLSWVESIAEEAKKGGSGQKELHWDSYEKIKLELHLQQLQHAAEKKKAKAKEMANERAKKAEQAKAKTVARLDHKRKEDGVINEDDEELTVPQGLKHSKRLMKLDRKTLIDGQVAAQRDITMSHISSLEKLDLELVKREKIRKGVSFADQIRAAKNKKMEIAMVASSSILAVDEIPG
ncbi:hypothetical protein C1H46_041336 [Malus baccata]|uniref:Nuclease associated modular domain-containing protein n=1 Tax=Malus baccata TaxID=106549 RepID=A0A540KFY0_MALBA|nr:hypothetical protein C1H46_041336 [Malus baccata]